MKEGVSDPRSQPRTVVNDPALTLDTPDWSWVSTGIRALDHAVEVIYAIRRQPISDTLASKAISLLVEHLPASIGTDGLRSTRASALWTHRPRVRSAFRFRESQIGRPGMRRAYGGVHRQVQRAPSLGAAGVPRNEIGAVAGTIAQALEQSQVMDRPLSREEVVALLEAAY